MTVGGEGGEEAGDMTGDRAPRGEAWGTEGGLWKDFGEAGGGLIAPTITLGGMRLGPAPGTKDGLDTPWAIFGRAFFGGWEGVRILLVSLVYFGLSSHPELPKGEGSGFFSALFSGGKDETDMGFSKPLSAIITGGFATIAGDDCCCVLDSIRGGGNPVSFPKGMS